MVEQFNPPTRRNFEVSSDGEICIETGRMTRVSLLYIE